MFITLSDKSHSFSFFLISHWFIAHFFRVRYLFSFFLLFVLFWDSLFIVSNSTNIGPDCLNDDPDLRNNVNGTGDKDTIHTAAPLLTARGKKQNFWLPKIDIDCQRLPKIAIDCQWFSLITNDYLPVYIQKKT